MGFDVVLLTIGFSESHDIIFSKEVNGYLNYSHHILEIDPETFHYYCVYDYFLSIRHSLWKYM
jgi:hypothetical protein